MRILIILLFSYLLFSCTTGKNKVYEWRGEGRTGIYQESNLLEEWPENGPDELWTLDSLGNGYGSPVFAGEQFFITGEIDSMAILYCFDLGGDKQWQTTLGKDWVTNFPGSRSAPTIAGDMIYVGTGLSSLYGVDRKSGEILWSREFGPNPDSVHGRFGHAEAALVAGERVFWTAGRPEHNVVALDRFTGEFIWTSKGLGEAYAYNSPKLIQLPSRSIMVTFTTYHLLGFDAGTGELLWSHEQDKYPLEMRVQGYGDIHANTVLYDAGSIFYAAGGGNGGVRLDLSEDGSEIKEVWRNPEFDSFMGGIVKIGNFIYGCGTTKKQLKSIDATSGQLTDSLKIGSGAIIAADGMLYFYNQRGEMKLLSCDEGKMQEISSFKISKGTKEHFAHPVIYRGVLYQRHGNMLMAYDIRMPGSQLLCSPYFCLRGFLQTNHPE
ncbi:MAG: PQQ-binding-like beta-propeller repeat protein [Bacteroidales bacterium]|nr:PQQ-binding-like beta-propeller repeat protein [Bacteroidales bacterium]